MVSVPTSQSRDCLDRFPKISVSDVKVSQIRPSFWHVIVVRLSRVNVYGLVLLFCCNINTTAITSSIINRLHRFKLQVSRRSRHMPEISPQSRLGQGGLDLV